MPLPFAHALHRLSSLALVLLPHVAQRLAAEQLLNRALATLLAVGDLDFLKGRSVAVIITDLDWCWPITLDQGRLRFLPLGSSTDVTIGGNRDDFLRLITRTADPDTLFFQRLLVIQGDTELGLQVKNTLDAVDWERMPKPLTRVLAKIGALVNPAS